MSDLLLRYALMARKHDRSWFRRFLLADELLLAAGVKKVVESAAARVDVTSQHEERTTEQEEVPESRASAVTFYRAAAPTPPQPMQFEEKTERFPLSTTLTHFTCPRCRGSGDVTCGRCSGSGQTSCGSCGGSGKVSETKDGKSTTRRCSSCGGDGEKTCGGCGGDGDVRCSRCSGEGRLASWNTAVYRYFVRRERAEHYPVKDPRWGLKSALDQWLKGHDERVQGWLSNVIGQHLGYSTPEVEQLTTDAKASAERLEAAAKQAPETCLFFLTERAFVPVGYCVTKGDDDEHWYWLTGRGEAAIETRPRVAPNWWKVLTPIMFVLGLACFWEIARRDQLTAIHLPTDFFESWAEWSLYLGGLLGAISGIVGVDHIVRSVTHVKTVALMPPPGPPTPYLPVLAALGAVCKSFKLADQIDESWIQMSANQPQADRQSRSVTVTLTNGQVVHLLEIASPEILSDKQLAELIQSVDGIVYLETPADSLEALKERVKSVPHPGVQKSSVVLDLASRDAIPEHGTVVSLEAIRRACLGEIEAPSYWDDHFERLWFPIASVLDRNGGVDLIALLGDKPRNAQPQVE